MKEIMYRNIFLIFVTFFLTGELFGQTDSLKIESDTLVSIPDTIKGNTMSLLFIGDLMGHGPQIRSAYNPIKKEYNYDTVFFYLKDVMSEPDFTIANLEVTLAGPVYKGYPQFSSPDALAEACKNAGIDVFVTANNHSCDRRLQGINRTLDVLDTLEIMHTGTFKNQKLRDSINLLIIEKDSIRVGILNYTYGTNGIPVPKPSVVNLIDRKIIKADIDSAENDSLDKLIILLHFGSEYQSYPNKTQTSLVSYLFEEGVDIIIGSHPHVIQKMMYLPGNDSINENFVAYSLGNFVSNQRKTRTDGGVMARIVLKKENGKTFIDESGYILTWVYKKLRAGSIYDYFILPAAEYEDNKSFFKSSVDYEKMKLYIKNSRVLLNKGNVNVAEYEFEYEEN
ncbi:MAG: CapA family protein [Bacteroidales bacterium]|nr:CapA family protein [Bacteroidales bacterium]